MSDAEGQSDEAEEFGRRMRTARAWAGFVRREEFVDALLERWPDWPIKSVVKRIENGEKWPDSRELQLWATRLHEFAGVPEWFIQHGWQGADIAAGRDEIAELREAVARHGRLLDQIKLIDMPGDQMDLATAAEQASEEMSQPRGLRSVPSEPRKRVRRK